MYPYPYTLNASPWGRDLVRFALIYDQLFSRHKVVENLKCTEQLQTDLEHLALKHICIQWIPPLWGPYFRPFGYTTSHFQDTRFSKWEMHWMTSNWPWTLHSQNSHVYWILASEPQIFVCFARRPGVFEIQGCRKSEMYQITSDWPWPLIYQRYPIYTEHFGNAPNTDWTRTLSCQKYPVYIEYYFCPQGTYFYPLRPAMKSSENFKSDLREK